MKGFKKIEDFLSDRLRIKTLGFWSTLGLAIVQSLLEGLILIPTEKVLSLFNFGHGQLVLRIVSFYLSFVILIKMYSEPNNNSTIRNKSKINPKLCLIIFLMFSGYIMFYSNTLGYLVLRYIPTSESLKKLLEVFNDKSMFVVLINILIFAPIFEELIFRRMILEGLLRNYYDKKAIILSALIFALMHGNIHQGINTFILGLMLGYIYVKTNSIILCMFGHFTNNFTTIMLSFINEYVIKITPIVTLLIGSIFIACGYMIYKNMIVKGNKASNF